MHLLAVYGVRIGLDGALEWELVLEEVDFFLCPQVFATSVNRVLEVAQPCLWVRLQKHCWTALVDNEHWTDSTSLLGFQRESSQGCWVSILTCRRDGSWTDGHGTLFEGALNSCEALWVQFCTSWTLWSLQCLRSTIEFIWCSLIDFICNILRINVSDWVLSWLEIVF